MSSPNSFLLIPMVFLLRLFLPQMIQSIFIRNLLQRERRHILTLELHIENPKLPFDDFTHTDSRTKAILLESLWIDVPCAPHIREQQLQICCCNALYGLRVTGICPIRTINNLFNIGFIPHTIANLVHNVAEDFGI